MNKHNKEYYSYGFIDDEATIDYKEEKLFINHMGMIIQNIEINKEQSNEGTNEGDSESNNESNVVSEISDFSFDKESGELKLNYKTSDGENKTLNTKVDISVVSGIDDITSLTLDEDSKLTLTYIKQGEEKTTDVNLMSLEDDVNWSRINK